MACNCNKKKRPQPTGSRQSENSDPRQTDPRTSTNLNVNSRKTQRYVLQKPNGSIETYGSRLEAMAEQARNGGTLRF